MSGRAKPYTHRVKILKYVKAGDAWRFANVVERSGRIMRDRALIAASTNTIARAAITSSGMSTASVTAKRSRISRP